MPADLAAALRERLLDRFPPTRAYPRSAFHADGMPPLVADFLDRALDRWVEIERMQFRSPWFDYEDETVQRTETAFFDALRRAARVPMTAWSDTLGGAIDLVVRFLTTPARALTDAIFEGEADPLPTDEVRTRLPMFGAHRYLPEVALAYLDRKQPETLTPDTLFALLDRIDRRVVQDYEADDWMLVLGPLLGLAEQAGLDGVTVDRIEAFFAAKGADDLAELVAEQDARVLDADALRTLLHAAFPDRDEHPDPPPVSDRLEDVTTEEAAPESDDSVSEADDEASAPPASLPPSSPPPADFRDDEPDSSEQEAFDEEDEADGETAREAEVSVSLEEDQPLRPAASPEASDAAPSDDHPSELDAAPPTPVTLEAENLNGALDDASETTSGADTSDPTDDAPEDARDDESVPLWRRFAAGSDGDSVNARFGPTETSSPISAESSGTVPLWKRFFSAGPDTDDETTTPPAAAPPTTATSNDTGSEQLEDGDGESRAASPSSSTSLDALETRVLGPMPPSQRKRFVKHLFRGDAGKYATVLHTLDGAASWTEASRIIARDVFKPSKVNIYGEHAVAFTDAVEARFRA